MKKGKLKDGMRRKETITLTNEKAGGITDKAMVISVFISLALLFSVSFIYLFWYGKGIFFYQENRSLFIYTVDYLRKFALKPGGLLGYTGLFLAQGYFSPLYGSLLISIIITLICLTFKAIVKRLAVSGPLILLFTLLPSVCLLLLQTQYEYPLQLTLGFLITAFWFLISISHEGKYSRSAILILFPLFYYLAGSFAFIYLGMYVIYGYMYFNGRQKYLIPLFLTGYAVLTFVFFNEIIFLQPLSTLVDYPLILNETARLTPYLIIIGVLLIIYPALVKISGLIKMQRFTRWITFATVSILFPLILFVLVKKYNPVMANVLMIEKYVHNQDWNSVISQYEKTRPSNIVGQFYYDLALSEKGQLCARMFSGPQSYGPLALSLEGKREEAYRTIYFYYGIGLINEAHHLAFELMVQHGYTPENIKMLIKTELIRGNDRIAERYLNVLTKTLHYKRWAIKYLRMLNKPGLVNSDAEFAEKIRHMPREDFFITTDDSRNIDLLLNSNPSNKKAFEYKLARLMLEKDIIEVVNWVCKMKGFGYDAIPKHVEEAVVAYRNYSGESHDLGGMLINPETERRFVRYSSLVSSYRGNKSLIGKAANRKEKDTFWYYLQFNTINSDFWKSSPADRSVY